MTTVTPTAPAGRSGGGGGGCGCRIDPRTGRVADSTPLTALALPAAVWFWRQKTGEGKGALEKTPHSAADTNVASPARTASGRQEFASAPVHVSIARTNRPPATTVPSPAEIASGANAADFTARSAQNVFEAQVALALKTLCGFSPAEIAKAFLTTEAAIAKRLTRAGQKIRLSVSHTPSHAGAARRVVYVVRAGDTLRQIKYSANRPK